MVVGEERCLVARGNAADAQVGRVRTGGEVRNMSHWIDFLVCLFPTNVISVIVFP